MLEFAKKSRLLLVAVAVLGYIFLLRPAREEINRIFLSPLAQHCLEISDNLMLKDQSSVSTSFFWGESHSPKELSVKVPFGLQFLIGFIGLIAMRANKKFFWALAIVQIAGSFIAITFFYAGSISSESFLVITDLVARYLIPLCSLGMVPLAFIQQRAASK